MYSEGDHSKLILDKLQSISIKIDALWACQLVDHGDSRSCSGSQANDEVDTEGTPGQNRMIDFSPVNVEAELPSSSRAPKGSHTTETNNVYTFFSGCR